MALDGHMFDKNNKEIDYFPINDDLHDAIFEQQSKLYRSYLYLRKLSDYYKDTSFNDDEVRKLADDLERYKSFIAKDYHSEINSLINKLSNSSIVKAVFYAD
jgi:DNA repair ATPase RecN